MHTSTGRETTVKRTRMLPAIDTRCPYCGEPIELFVDGSAGDQQYIEDCQVCCRPIVVTVALDADGERSEEHTSELQSLMRISYAVFCLTKKHTDRHTSTAHNT